MSTTVSKYQTDAPFAGVSPASDEIDLRELFSVIWQGKWLIVAITAVFTIGAVIYAIKQPNIYKSEVLLAPSSGDQNSGLGALASQFGGLASLAGVSLGSAGSIDKTRMAIEVIKSRQFASHFIQRHNILPDLMAAKSWNMQDNSIIYNTDIYEVSSKKWVRKINAPFNSEPSMQEAFKVFKKIVIVNEEKTTGMVTISVEHVSPYVARQWVSWLVEDINKVMKERDLTEASRSSEFLNKQIALTNVADIKVILYKLIEEQAKTIMFAEVRDEYAFKTIDPAFVPEEKSRPKRSLICILGVLLGGTLGIVLVLIKYIFRKYTLKCI